ncbi:Siroheme biosynthesis protein met8 [Leucoagaricus sp. SymC.cos]|nr:Siroheme biosynthesis protein met8 [Leucoagaricus sp. SymC.cos]
MSSQVGGGSLLIAWQLSGKKALIIGGGEIASQRVDSILVTDAHITVMSPFPGLHPRTQNFIVKYPTRITYLNKSYRYDPEDLELLKYDMVLTALDDFELSQSIYHGFNEWEWTKVGKFGEGEDPAGVIRE